MIKIKKYKNRKLYNTETGTYLNFTGVQEMIQSDVDFVIVDARTKNDVTASVLTEMVCQNLRKAKNSPELVVLKAVLKNNSSLDGQLSFNFT